MGQDVGHGHRRERLDFVGGHFRAGLAKQHSVICVTYGGRVPIYS